MTLTIDIHIGSCTHLGGSGWGGLSNSLISKNLAHYSLSLKFLLIL